MIGLQSYRSKRYIILLFLLLWGTNFLGFAPIADNMDTINTVPLVVFFMFFAWRYRQKNNEYYTGMLILAFMFVLDAVSAFIFRNKVFLDTIRSQASYFYLFIFFIIAGIRPTITEMEKVFVTLGIAGLTLYFVQYALLPFPILESLTSGWRTNNDLDIVRFGVTGEVVIFLLGLYSLNRILITWSNKYFTILLAVFTMAILHGYRSMIVAFVLSCLFLYWNFIRRNFSIKNIAIVILFISVGTYLISSLPMFDFILSFIQEKNQTQIEEGYEVNRILEFEYFRNYLVSDWEWLFGCGFTENETERMIANWVDLGFIGMSFMGGIGLVFAWVYLICLNFRKVPMKYFYLNAFSLFLLASSVTLNVAFAVRATAIEALVFYLFWKIRKEIHYSLPK